ncbi:MAG: capsule assembly Wzi family protein, partial [Sediminibacterium sp.]|nr:capsule assembly Wzi family protein [Sediminibacterium sp.]
MHTKIFKHSFIVIGLLCSLLQSPSIFAQSVWENPNHEVYNYLNRLSAKGLIDFRDIIRPISREVITKHLLELEEKVNELSSIEKKELTFYLKEYRPIQVTDNDKIHLVKKDPNKRIRGLFIITKDFQLNADPIGSLTQISHGGNSITQMSNGLQFWGKIKNLGFQLYYRDYTETGIGVRQYRTETPITDIIELTGTAKPNRQNFSELRANISYSFKKGSISFGKDKFLWGYGENGQIVLSDKSPTYPYIRLDYQPFSWLQFNYTHAWLNSNIIDSAATYRTGTTGVGDFRDQYIPKYMATHTITFKPTKGLDIALGESIVYSDKTDVGFFIPINLFKIYDNNRSNYNIRAGSNGQYFLQASSRNYIKNTHLYASLFIDEISLGNMFNSAKSRNQLGYTLGGSVTDLFLPYLTLGAEYTRVNPFVYNNLIPAQTFTQFNSSLGDWMG